MTAFTAALKDKMQAQGMNQTTLAQRTGRSKSAISQLVNGINPPSKRTLQLLAAVLNCTVSELTGEGFPLDPDFEFDVPVPVAARLIGKPEQFVRSALIQGTGPFGFAVKGDGRYSFSISPHKLAEYTGKPLAEHRA